MGFLSMALLKHLQTSMCLSALLMEGQNVWQLARLSSVPLLSARQGIGREGAQLCPSVITI